MDAAAIRPATTELRVVEASAGLSAAQVAERVAAGRTNAFKADTSRSWGSIVRTNVFTLFNAIVFACFLALLLLGRWQDALFGLAALSNALIGCYQEIRAKIALDKLALLNAPRARVRRDGAEVEIAPSDVVIDDVLVLRAGDQVPADGVLLNGRSLQIDESMLTGESDPVDKHPGDTLLSASIVITGSGDGQATKVGADSYANTFANEAKRFSLMKSELRRSVNRVLTWVAWGIGPISLLVLNSQVMVQGGWKQAFSDGSWRQAAVDSIAVITAMIPLGLVLMTSIAFAVGAARLAREKVLVQELPAVEGLARVDIICLDKTGTLTIGDIEFDAEHVLPGAATASGWKAALAWFGSSADANATARSLAAAYPALYPMPATAATIPFSSARKWSAVSLQDASASGTWVLGGPEMVLPRMDAELAARVKKLASSGRRTMLLAHAVTPISAEQSSKETLPVDLTAVALLTLRERVRPDAAKTLSYFHAQGVAVRIISGDNPDTVAAIAREVGLDAPQGYDARQLPEDDAALAEVLEAHAVFGRVTPDQKKRLVIALQAKGHTVAMTGDGVNDALAIKQADIGIAMESGSPATKAVARLVLLDGKFSHLPGVVTEGRQVIANIERVSMLFLTKTSYAVMLAVLFGAALMTFPFLPRQLSIVDGLTIGLPAFFLALLPNAQRYLPGLLRRSRALAAPSGVVSPVAPLSYSVLANAQGVDTAQLRTGSTLILAIVGLWILAVLARPITAIKGVVIGAMMVALVLVYTVPIVGEFLGFSDPGPIVAALVAVIAGTSIVLIEAIRLVHRRLIRRPWFMTPLKPRRTRWWRDA